MLINESQLNDLYQTLDPIAFSIGPFSARWYGIAYALGFLLAAVVIYFVGKRWKMRFDFENICVVIICAMVGVIIRWALGLCARLQWSLLCGASARSVEFREWRHEFSRWLSRRAACWHRGGEDH